MSTPPEKVPTPPEKISTSPLKISTPPEKISTPPEKISEKQLPKFFQLPLKISEPNLKKLQLPKIAKCVNK